MDSQSLKAFLHVAETSSFSEAAETLFLTQPAVSKRIANLEQELDAKLFDRINRKVFLTEAGKTLLPKARQILHDMAAAERAINDMSGEVSGELSMGISHHIGLHRLPPVLRAFSQRYPNVRLDIDFLDSEQAHDLILRGEMDLAVITLAPQLEQNLEGFVVWPDPLSIVIAKGHPLANEQTVSLKTLSKHTALLPGLNTYTGRIVKGLFDEAGFKMDVAMATNYLETIKMMVSVGLGWSILPHSLVDDSLIALQVEGKQLERQLGCVHHKNRSLSNAAEAFVAMLRAEADQAT